MSSIQLSRRTGAAFIGAAALVLGALAIGGCSNGNSLGPGGNTNALARSFNGLQGCTTAVDIEQVSILPVLFGNLGYASAPAPGYAAIRAGVGLHFGVFPTGMTTNAIALSDLDLNPHNTGTVNSGTYSLVTTGICGSGSGPTAPQLLRLIDAFPTDFSGTQAGTVALRVINLVPDLGGGMTLASNGAAVHGTDDAGTNNVAYAGTGGFNSSHYNSGINLAGSPILTVRTNANAILATVPNFTFTPNHAYTLFVVGEVTPVNGGSAITVVPVQDF